MDKVMQIFVNIVGYALFVPAKYHYVICPYKVASNLLTIITYVNSVVNKIQYL